MASTTQKVSKRLVKSARTNSRRVHITPRDNGWAVRKEGNFKASKILGSQKEAVKLAKGWVEIGSATAVVVHRRNGDFVVSK